MGLEYTLHDLKDLPTAFDVVWCKMPRREMRKKPGPIPRPVLVVDSYVVETEEEEKVGVVVVQYGGDYQSHHLPNNLEIPWTEYKLLGLHKPTLFRLDEGNLARCIWCEEYFVPQGYVRDQGILIGSLNAKQQARLLDCFNKRKLPFPPKRPDHLT